MFALFIGILCCVLQIQISFFFVSSNYWGTAEHVGIIYFYFELYIILRMFQSEAIDRNEVLFMVC
jgi:hypothetical protein